MTKRYWKIECSEHKTSKLKVKVPETHLSEKRLKHFIQVMIAKYALTPQEILDEHIAIPFKHRKEYVTINRTNSLHNGKVSIIFFADSGGISVTAHLVDE
jgi:hypothetical protein